MNSRILAATVPALLTLWQAAPALALDGEPFIHDPSTVIECDGKWYTFGTGSGGLMSDDGWSWRSGAVRPGGGVAPDVMKIGDRYLVSYADGGSGAHSFRVHTMWTKTLDPASPECKFEDDTVVINYNIMSECDAIDPSLLLDPTDGRLWLSYGTYFGYIQVVELDPKTAKRIPGAEPVNVAIDCEATDLIYRDGYYYLLGTHGTCCAGANSTYNIRVGRSKKVTGPYLDNQGMDMLKGGGKLVAAASGHFFGLGHFGRTVVDEGVERFSCHYEADLDRGGRSVLDIRPLLWRDGWPIGGDNFQGGAFQIQSERSGYALELNVDDTPMPGGMMGFGGGRGRRGAAPGGTNAPAATNAPGASNAPAGGPGMGMGRGPSGPSTPITLQTLAQVSSNWPAENIDLRIGDFMVRPHQKWTISPVTNAPGFLGSPYFKIQITGSERSLAAAEGGEVVTVPAFTGAPEQLWRIEQLTDGTYRIMPKAVPGSKEPVALTTLGYSTATLEKFDPKSDKARWNFKTP